MGEFQTKRKLELENIFVKKYKLTSEISTCSFNEKENKEYYQHLYCPYTENRIIDFVNDDCLAEIFTYVPAWERPKISLVCQKWKRALEYSWGNVKKLKLTYWKYDEKPTWLQKYQTTLDGQLSFLKSLLSKCGHYLTELDLTVYSHCNIVPIINEYCPNLLQLRLRFTYIDDVILYDAFSRLSQLKVLSIIFQNFDNDFIPLTLIYSLRNVANTLTDLILSNWVSDVHHSCKFPKETDGVIYELKALKKVVFGGIKLSQNLTNYLYYKMSAYTNLNVLFGKGMTEQFQNIIKLDLHTCVITDDGLYSIANNIKHLKVFRAIWSDLTNVSVVTISKHFMDLMALSFIGFNNVIDSSSIKLLKNLTIIRLPHNSNVTDDLALKVIENSPELALFILPNTGITIEFIKKVADISRNRKQHLDLGISFPCEKKLYESPYLTITVRIF